MNDNDIQSVEIDEQALLENELGNLEEQPEICEDEPQLTNS